MDLLPYNKKIVSRGHGFRNFGNTCYFNSILQCIISCPSIFEVLEQNKEKEHIKSNSLAQSLMSLSNAAIAGENISDKCLPVWREILRISQNRKDSVRIGLGQQDAHEGLMMVLDVLDTIPEVKRLFEHRHTIQILCGECRKWVVNKAETNLVFEVQPDLKTEQDEIFKSVDGYYNTTMSMNEFLKKQNGFVDGDYICPNEECKKKGKKFKTTTLTMIPEILPVVIKKYTGKTVTPFPFKLELVARCGTKIFIYVLGAQSEHAGGQHGGHYWAVCLRQDDVDTEKLTWKTLNDTSVAPGTPGPTSNSYILFYHFLSVEDVTV